MVFSDPRRFGTLAIVPGGTPAKGGGVDPTTAEFTPESLGALLAGSRQAMKAWLLRQDRLGGIGNIYASEILFAARLDPRRGAGTLGPQDVRRLHAAIRAILRRAIRHCGTTFSDFGDVRGRPGGFGRLLAVYGREGEPCRCCGRGVRRIVQQSRSTYLCGHCQRRTGSGTDTATDSGRRETARRVPSAPRRTPA